MRGLALLALSVFVALVMAGCSAVSSLPGLSASAGQAPAVPTPVAASSGQVAGASPVAAPSKVGEQVDPTVAAIQAVIQKANQEQADAFTQNDATLMKDTATSDYYAELAQTNSDMANGGVTAIKLVKLEWGPITLTGANTARATTYETWQTSFDDGSTDQGREQNVYVLVQDQGVWKIQSDDHPNSPGGQGGSGGPAPSRPASPAPVTPPAGAPATGSDTSRNWSGYAASSGTYTSVTGTWTIPQPQVSSTASTGATWVGIGGVDTRDLIQAGTEETVSASGDVSYDAWVETLPRAARPVSLNVKGGDSVTISISEQSSNNWLIQFKNNTTGENYQTTMTYQSSRSSAEWVEEAPSSGRRLLPIDEFGTVQFSGGTAVKDGKTVTIADAGAQPITMSDGRGGALATPSVLTQDGQGFTVSRTNVAPASPVTPGFGRRPRGGF